MTRPLFWHQGLFLQPQHFQLQDAFFQSLLIPYRDTGTPHLWGVSDIEIDRPALENRSVSLSRGSFLFQDGTYCSFPGNSILESRSFKASWVEGGRPLTVYVGLKKWNEQGENVTLVDSLDGLFDVATRSVALKDPEEVPDLHAAGPPGTVQRLHHVPKLFWSTELDLLGEYLLIPIARLERFGEEIRLSENFVAPCVSFHASDVLALLIKEIKDQVTARCHKLEAYKTQKGIQTAEFGSRDMVYLLALRLLTRYVPLLLHLYNNQKAHPWTVYGVLTQLIGELSSFSQRVNVFGESDEGEVLLQNYDHQNLWRSFSSAQILITRLLDEITAGPEYTIPLHFDGTYFSADLEAAMLEGVNRYYLVLRTEEDPKRVLEATATVTKLSAREFLPIIIARALPGLELEHLPVPPQELPRRAHCIYFQINHRGEQWSYIEKNRNIALYWDAAPEDLNAEIMIVGRS